QFLGDLGSAAVAASSSLLASEFPQYQQSEKPMPFTAFDYQFVGALLFTALEMQKLTEVLKGLENHKLSSHSRVQAHAAKQVSESLVQKMALYETLLLVLKRQVLGLIQADEPERAMQIMSQFVIHSHGIGVLDTVVESFRDPAIQKSMMKNYDGDKQAYQRELSFFAEVMSAMIQMRNQLASDPVFLENASKIQSKFQKEGKDKTQKQRLGQSVAMTNLLQDELISGMNYRFGPMVQQYEAFHDEEFKQVRSASEADWLEQVRTTWLQAKWSDLSESVTQAAGAVSDTFGQISESAINTASQPFSLAAQGGRWISDSAVNVCGWVLGSGKDKPETD
ncbi:MAG: hypothetical protein AAF202_02120, partial [Pseudomonadota bacterium]